MALVFLGQTLWVLRLDSGQGDPKEGVGMALTPFRYQRRGRDSGSLLEEEGTRERRRGMPGGPERRVEAAVSAMQYYWSEGDQPVVGPPTGNMVLVHMGRCGSTLVQRYVTIMLLEKHNGENLMEILEADNVLRIMRKYLEVKRGGSVAALQQLEAGVGGRVDSDDLRLEAEDASAVYNPGDSLQLGELARRSDEEYEALVFALRFLTAPPRGTEKRMTLSSLKMWAICGVGFGVEQYFEALQEAGVAHVVVLHRNYLRRLLSARAAEVSGQWHAMGKENVNCKRAVPINTQKQSKCDPGRQHNMTDLFRMSDAAYEEIFTGGVAKLFPDAVVLSYENDIYPTGTHRQMEPAVASF